MSLEQRMLNHDMDKIWTVLNDIRLGDSANSYEFAKAYINRMYPDNEILSVQGYNAIDLTAQGIFNLSEVNKSSNRDIICIVEDSFIINPDNPVNDLTLETCENNTLHTVKMHNANDLAMRIYKARNFDVGNMYLFGVFLGYIYTMRDDL